MIKETSVNCLQCHGSGKYPSSSYKCSECNGSGKMKKFTCKGKLRHTSTDKTYGHWAKCESCGRSYGPNAHSNMSGQSCIAVWYKNARGRKVMLDSGKIVDYKDKGGYWSGRF